MVKDLQQFIKNIIKKAGMESLPQKFLDEYEDKLIIEFQRRIGVLMVKELDEQGIKEFDKLIQGNPNPDQRVLLNFFNVHISNFKQKFEKGSQDFTQEFVDELKKLKSSIR
jgi:hypothetical protein